MSFYRLSSMDELPLIMILDPITGAKQRQLTGFIEPQRCTSLFSVWNSGSNSSGLFEQPGIPSCCSADPQHWCHIAPLHAVAEVQQLSLVCSYVVGVVLCIVLRVTHLSQSLC